MILTDPVETAHLLTDVAIPAWVEAKARRVRYRPAVPPRIPVLPQHQDWMDVAACRDADPEVFFVSSNETRADRERQAKAICRMCPSRPECLRWAFQINDKYAVLGGLTPEERRALKRKRLRQRAGAA